MDGHGADSLGERGASRDVDEQKESFLPTRPMVPAHHPVAQGPPADDLADLEHEDDGAEGHLDEAGSWLDDVDERDHRPIDERLDKECDKERGLLHRSPQSRTRSEDLQGPMVEPKRKPWIAPIGIPNLGVP